MTSIDFCHRARRKNRKNAGMVPLLPIDPNLPRLTVTHPVTAFTHSPPIPDHEYNDMYGNRSSLLIPSTPLENERPWASRQQNHTPSSSRLNSFSRPSSVAPVDAFAFSQHPGNADFERAGFADQQLSNVHVGRGDSSTHRRAAMQYT